MLTQVKRELDAALAELAGARTSEELLQTMLAAARDAGAAKEAEQCKRAEQAEGELSALRMLHAQVEGRLATSAAQVRRRTLVA